MTLAHPAAAPLLALAAALLTFQSQAQTQLPAESARALVHRNQPESAAFSNAVAQRLQLQPGYAAGVYASGLGQPRMMDTAPDGTVYLTRRGSNDVLALRDTDGDGRADDIRTVATLTGVHGVAVNGGYLYLASSTTIWRTPLGSNAAPQVIVSGLPDGGQHPNRMLRFGPDGGMYVSVGSSCNDCAEENQLERGTMIRYSADGSSRTVIAKGLRNTIGYDWHPATGALWGMDQGTDFRGDRIPPEELNEIVAGRNYGWPVCYGDRVVDPMTNAAPERLAFAPGVALPSGDPVSRETYCARTVPARLLAPAHSAPMAMRFAAGGGQAYVAMRGSWNRGDPAGYKVARIVFDAAGQPRRIEDFVTGFLDPSGPLIYGRPVGITFAADGALLVSDDTNGAIYRIAATSAR